MSRAADYLRAPSDYCARLGGLRWSELSDAIEKGDGSTFAFAVEVIGFLEGFALKRPLVHFGYVLHLLALLRDPRREPTRAHFGRLHRAYREAGSPPRTAGVLCALLCDAVPAAPNVPTPEELSHWLVVHSCTTAPAQEARQPQQPPLSPDEFEARIARALEKFSDEALVHWLWHGQGPAGEEAEQVARALLFERPRSLQGALADLSRRERLRGAVPYVAQFVSAFSLPPRRLASHELPVGGYADVAARGQPEQMLLSQFALDDLELVRRYAENELLYYRREEPHARAREELVVLLDQGVRTWGPVRLVLAATVFALGQFSLRKKLSFRFACTSAGGAPVDPLEIGTDELAELVEASDLSASPALALERVLEQEDEVRDVVLLTHPRNVLDPDVGAAARRCGRQTRLFALAVDGEGAVELSELRHGAPVSLGRFRIELDRGAPAVRVGPWAPWQGDVEPVGFPFRFGIEGGKDRLRFDFDDAGEHLICAAGDSALYVTRIADGQTEVVPRARHGGGALQSVLHLLGVEGGFVVVGWLDGGVVAAHYDFQTRRARIHPLDEMGPSPRNHVRYVRPFHALVVAASIGQAQGIRLSTGARDLPATALVFPRQDDPTLGPDEYWAEVPLDPDWVASGSERPFWPTLFFDKARGELALRHVDPPCAPFVPLADGKPLLAGHVLTAASARRQTIAAVFQTPDNRVVLWVFAEGRPVVSFPLGDRSRNVALSSDGLRMAFSRRPSQVEVRDSLNGRLPLVRTPLGRFHNNVRVEMGGYWLAIHLDRSTHLFSWGGMREGHEYGRDNVVGALVVGEGHPEWYPTPVNIPNRSESRGNLPAFLAYDPARFRAAVQGVFVLAVDRFGQVFLFEANGDLVCAFFAYRSSFAAWMPDGTCLGPPSLLGRPETPGAAGRIVYALKQASHRQRGAGS